MSKKYDIIARYTDGVAKYWIGRKIDPGKPLDDDNVEWKERDGSPLIFDEYSDAAEEVNAEKW